MSLVVKQNPKNVDFDRPCSLSMWQFLYKDTVNPHSHMLFNSRLKSYVTKWDRRLSFAYTSNSVIFT